MQLIAAFLIELFSFVLLQAGLLAQQDAFAPFIWVAIQSVLNVMGDLLLIQHFKQGLTGAAWATVVSQLVGTIGLIWMLTFRGEVSDRLHSDTSCEIAQLPQMPKSPAAAVPSLLASLSQYQRK